MENKIKIANLKNSLDVLGMTYDGTEPTAILIDITQHSYVMIDFDVMEIVEYEDTKLTTVKKFFTMINKKLDKMYSQIIKSEVEGKYPKHPCNFIMNDGDKWISVFNEDNNCWVEEFETLEEAMKDIGLLENEGNE